MKIAYAIDGTFIGGGHRHVISLACGARAAGHEPIVLVSGQGPFTAELNQSGIPWKVIPMGKRPSFAAFHSWKKYLNTHSVDILHLHGGVAGFWGRLAASKRRHYKIILTLHGIHYFHHSNKFVSLLSWIVDRCQSDIADMTICVSSADFDTAVKKKISSPEKTCVIHNGIDVKVFRDRGLSQFKNIHPSDPIEIGLVGRLTRMKGQRYGIEAMALLKNEFPGMRLHLIGTGEDLLPLKSLSQQLGLSDRVVFAGFEANMQTVYGKFDILLMPSLWEGQPLTLMEALAAGLPSIVSDLPCVKEILTHEKECLMVPVKNPEAIAGAIARLIKDTQLRRMIIEAGARVAEHFDASIMVKKTLAKYESFS